MPGNRKISEANTQTVISSAIVAKAAVRRENGRIDFIVVYQASTRHEFYWIYQVEKTDTPRRAWKQCSMQGRDGAATPARDFGSFVSDYARLHHAKVLFVRVFHARHMATLYTKTAHESIHGNWAPQNLSHETNAMQDRRLQSKIRGSMWIVR